MLTGNYLSVAEAAAELGRTATRVRQLISSGQLEAEQVDKRFWFISRKVLDDFKKIERTPGLHVDKRPPARKGTVRSRRTRNNGT